LAGKLQAGPENLNKTLEFYNRDKGRKTLNLTEKYKK